MIVFLSTRANRHPVYRFLMSPWGRPWLHTIMPVTYRTFLEDPIGTPGTYVFADIESLRDADRRRLAPLHAGLSARADVRVLNDPTRTLRRYDLLTGLHARGINAFAVRRADDRLDTLRYPVFVRAENDHLGARSPLLDDRAALDVALDGLRTTYPEYPPGGWLVTEFCETADREGVRRKYAAFVVDGHIFPRHLFFSGHWMIKGSSLAGTDRDEEEWEYMATNPHQQALAAICRDAGVEYGRVDYGVRDGRVQVWEINTNPVILRPTMAHGGPRARVHAHFAQALDGRLRQLPAFPLAEPARGPHLTDVLDVAASVCADEWA